jgi:hypothetical protein
MIFYTRPEHTLTQDMLKCARDIADLLFEVGDGVQVSGNESDYQVWQVRPNAYLVIPVERLQVKEG